MQRHPISNNIRKILINNTNSLYDNLKKKIINTILGLIGSGGELSYGIPTHQRSLLAFVYLMIH